MLKSLQTAKESLAEQVASQIVEMITDREYAPGDKIPPELEMVEALNVSRGTVREAIKLLVSRNVLEVHRGCGTYVSEQPGCVDDPFGLKYVSDRKKLYKDLLTVRLHLEPWAAMEAAIHATDEEITEIVRLCDETESQIRAGELHMDKDMQFHQAIAKATHNIMLPLIIPNVNKTVMLFSELRYSLLLEETITLHRRTAEAIAKHDPEEARNAMEKHIRLNVDKTEELEIKMVF